MSDPRPIGVFDSGVGGLTVLREIVRRSPAESTIYLGDNARAPVRHPLRRRGPRLLDPGARRARRARRQGHRRRLQHLDRRRHRRRSGAATTCRSSASSGPGASAAALATRNRRVGVIATPATIRSHAYFSAIKDENPAVEVYEHATPALVPLVEAGRADGPRRRGGRRRGARPAARRARRGRRVRSSRCRPARRSTRCCSAAPTTRCCGRSSRRSSASGSRSSIRRPRRPRRWPSCSASTASRPRDDPRDGRRRGPAATSARRATVAATIAADDRRRRTPSTRSPGGCSARPSRTSSAIELAVAGPMSGADRGDRRPSWRDDRVWQAGFLVGSALGAAATVAGPTRRSGPRGAAWSTGRRSSGSPIAPPAAGARDASTPAELRAAEPAYAAAMARIVPGALATALGSRAAGRRRAVRRRRPGGLGPGQHRVVRVAHRQARGRPARPGHAARRRPRQGDDGPRQPLDHDPPARLPARVHGAARPRPVRPRAAVGRGDPGPAAVRRGEHPRDGRARSACRSTRSGPGSPCTRRPTPSSSRRIPWLRPYLAERLERQLDACSAATPAGSAARRCAGSAGRSAARATASTGWSG